MCQLDGAQASARSARHYRAVARGWRGLCLMTRAPSRVSPVSSVRRCRRAALARTRSRMLVRPLPPPVISVRASGFGRRHHVFPGDEAIDIAGFAYLDLLRVPQYGLFSACDGERTDRDSSGVLGAAGMGLGGLARRSPRRRTTVRGGSSSWPSHALRSFPSYLLARPRSPSVVPAAMVFLAMVERSPGYARGVRPRGSSRQTSSAAESDGMASWRALSAASSGLALRRGVLAPLFAASIRYLRDDLGACVSCSPQCPCGSFELVCAFELWCLLALLLRSSPR